MIVDPHPVSDLNPVMTNNQAALDIANGALCTGRICHGTAAATQDNDAASPLLLDTQHHSQEWQFTAAVHASLNPSLLAAGADLEEVEVDGFVFRRKRSVSAATTSGPGRESAALQASSKRRRTSTAAALSGGWVQLRGCTPNRRTSMGDALPGGRTLSSFGCAGWCITVWGQTTVRASCEVLQAWNRLTATQCVLVSAMPGSGV